MNLWRLWSHVRIHTCLSMIARWLRGLTQSVIHQFTHHTRSHWVSHRVTNSGFQNEESGLQVYKFILQRRHQGLQGAYAVPRTVTTMQSLIGSPVWSVYSFDLSWRILRASHSMLCAGTLRKSFKNTHALCFQHCNAIQCHCIMALSIFSGVCLMYTGLVNNVTHL